jgi:gamma-glutamyl-gamma-aminobutyrate hydrolase PuuD
MLQNEEIGGPTMLIAIPTSMSKTQYYLNQAYVDYVEGAGFEPMMVTPKNDILEMAQRCHGLLLPGGIDIDPIFYGEENYDSMSVDPIKDDFERQVFFAFIELGKPIFGICRGAQLIAREFLLRVHEAHKRLEFVQHIRHHALATALVIGRDVRSHGVFVDRNVLYGEHKPKYQKVFTNSMHHQCLFLNPLPKPKGKKRQPPDVLVVAGLRVLGYTRYGMEEKEKGHIVEAFDINGWVESPIVAVQWHPEELKDYALIQNFFSQHVDVMIAEG